MRAVVLAAGRGSRLGSEDLPKPLWEIGPRSLTDPAPVAIAERQILLLRELGVDPVIVMVGWQADRVRERLAATGAVFAQNTHPDISASGTSHSLQFAACSDFDPLDGREPCLLLDADLVYERSVLETIVNGEGPSRLLISPRIADDSEEVRVYARDGRPRLIGKHLCPPVTDGFDLLGEATGIVRFEPGDHALVRALLDWLVGRPGGPRPRGFSGIASEHEELAQYLMNLRRLGAQPFDDGLLFMEADFAADFERARGDLYPRILERDA